MSVGCLGTDWKNSVPPEETGRKKRYRLQDAASQLLPNHRVCNCLRSIAPVRNADGIEMYTPDTVGVDYNPHTNRASFRGLQTCKSVWVCPVCSGRISEQRRQELEYAIAENNHNVLLVTYTLRHHKSDPLRDLLDILGKAQRRLKSGRFWQEFKKKYDWLGDVKGLETTYGDNGWHPHNHVLMFVTRTLTEDEINSLTAELREKWQHILWSIGGDAEYEIGVDVKTGSKYVAEYLSKFGRMPETDLDAGKGWDKAAEVTKSNHKIAKSKEGLTPWGLLDEYSKTGNEAAARLFREYAEAMKGRNQLSWSRGLKAHFGIDDIPDEAIEMEDQEAQPFIEVPKLAWAGICIAHARPKLLQLIEDTEGDKKTALEFVERFHQRMVKHKRKYRKKALEHV